MGGEVVMIEPVHSDHQSRSEELVVSAHAFVGRAVLDLKGFTQGDSDE